ncbi:MAG: hypothetical protein K8J08_12860 [Thermoanaerobaculia bacterium]|nr:hypothetical protein [Thermoanaerobaculia bacterium]
MKIHLLSLASLLLLVAGCAPPTLDSSNLADSTEKVRKSLDASLRDDFDLALIRLQEASDGSVRGTAPFSLDGMTGENVLLEAERIDLRSELAWAQQSVETEQQIVGAQSILEGLRIEDFQTSYTEGRILATFRVDNGLETPIDTAWLRIDASKDGYPSVHGEDAVAFRPALKPAEARDVEIIVTSEVISALPPDSETSVRVRFTLVENGGDIVLQEPTEEDLARARGRLAEAESRRDELQKQLDAKTAPPSDS